MAVVADMEGGSGRDVFGEVGFDEGGEFDPVGAGETDVIGGIVEAATDEPAELGFFGGLAEVGGEVGVVSELGFGEHGGEGELEAGRVRRSGEEEEGGGQHDGEVRKAGKKFNRARER